MIAMWLIIFVPQHASLCSPFSLGNGSSLTFVTKVLIICQHNPSIYHCFEGVMIDDNDIACAYRLHCIATVYTCVGHCHITVHYVSETTLGPSDFGPDLACWLSNLHRASCIFGMSFSVSCIFEISRIRVWVCCSTGVYSQKNHYINS